MDGTEDWATPKERVECSTYIALFEMFGIRQPTWTTIVNSRES